METDRVFCAEQTEFLYEMWMHVSLQTFNRNYIDVSHWKGRERAWRAETDVAAYRIHLELQHSYVIFNHSRRGEISSWTLMPLLPAFEDTGLLALVKNVHIEIKDK